VLLSACRRFLRSAVHPAACRCRIRSSRTIGPRFSPGVRPNRDRDRVDCVTGGLSEVASGGLVRGHASPFRSSRRRPFRHALKKGESHTVESSSVRHRARGVLKIDWLRFWVGSTGSHRGRNLEGCASVPDAADSDSCQKPTGASPLIGQLGIGSRRESLAPEA
jgi:hypothetical protein